MTLAVKHGYWAVIQVESRCEHIVRVMLMRVKFKTYLPRIKVHGRIAFLFPGYLFVHIVDDRFYNVRWMPHIIRLLMSGDKPARLSEKIVEGIRKREVGGFVNLPIQRLKQGQKVRIVRGSFEGQVGLYEGMTSKDRERVLLELLGQKVPVELPSRDLEPLPIASA